MPGIVLCPNAASYQERPKSWDHLLHVIADIPVWVDSVTSSPWERLRESVLGVPKFGSKRSREVVLREHWKEVTSNALFILDS